MIIFGLFACHQNTDKISTVPTGGDFSLETQRGLLQTEQQRGKVLFVFFGFTQCPHVCPTIFSQLNRMLKSIPTKERDHVLALFISIDDRDTITVLKEKMSHYPEQFFAGTTNKANLDHILKKFGARYEITHSDGERLIDHTSLIYVINRKGEWVESLPYDTSAEQLKRSYQTADTKLPIYHPLRARREILKIAEDKECDLAQKPCELLGMKIDIDPRPVVSNRRYTIKVSGTSKWGKPLAVDVQGVDFNMGYIRPQLTQTGETSYQGSFFIPTCEKREMSWIARLIISEDPPHKSLNFMFKTFQ